MTKYEIHSSLIRAVLSRDSEINDILLCMVLLHTHDITLNPEVSLVDVERNNTMKPLLLPAITRRHAAEVVASLWPASDERGGYDYWYSLYNRRSPYEVVADVPTDQQSRLQELKELLLCDHRVMTIVED